MTKSNQKKIRVVQGTLWAKRRSEMSTMERVQELQRKLYLKAKREKEYRFYILYDKVFLDYVLVESYKRVKANGGSPGVDGQTFKDIEESGREEFLKGLKEDLRKRTYKLVIEPLFEADFEDSSHGFRPKRSASDAISEIKTNLQEGKTEVYDADLSKYFDTIPHDRLIEVLKLRISDGRIIDLMKLWLKTPYVEDGKMKGGKRNKVGTPQGGVISPLLSNIYLHLLDRIVNNKKSIFTQQGVKIVRYADDFVLMGKEIGDEVIKKLMSIVDRMGLKINEEKSKMVKAKQEPFHFLGFTIRYDRCLFNKGKHYWHIKPSEKSSKRLREKISTKLKAIGHYPPQGVAKELNMIILGWLNYYDIRGLSYTQMVRKDLMWYLKGRLYRYYNRKSQRRSRLYGSQAFELLLRHGMVNPYKSSGLTP